MSQSRARSAAETVENGIASALDEAKFDLVQSFIRRLFPAYESRGLEFNVSTDFDEFVAIRRASANGFVYPTYDPRQSRIAPANWFWVKICNAAVDIIPAQATRPSDPCKSFP